MTDKPHMTLPNGEKLFEGDYGITRGGDRVGPLRMTDDDSFPWLASPHNYTKDGTYCYAHPYHLDIISRWSSGDMEPLEEFVGRQLAANVSLDTLENLTEPLGLLDDATRKALINHGGPYQYFGGDVWRDTYVMNPTYFAYRVKRAPKVETVKLSLHDSSLIGWAAIDKVDGEYDLTTVRPWVEGAE